MTLNCFHSTPNPRWGALVFKWWIEILTPAARIAYVFLVGFGQMQKPFASAPAARIESHLKEFCCEAYDFASAPAVRIASANMHTKRRNMLYITL